VESTRHSIVKTYRYLRIAMVLLVLLLAASVFREMAAVGFDCAQKSISSYYYTPAQAVFVGALVAIGACLVVIKGSTDTEDVLLNIAGMLMPVVAFVPTPYEAACSSTPLRSAQVTENVTNNVFALLVMGAVALLAAAFLKRRGPETMDRQVFGVGVGLSVLIYLVVAVTYAADRAFFVNVAHYGAAIPMFGCIVAVAVINARLFGLGPDPTRRNRIWLNRYALVAEGMVASMVLGAAAYLLLGWEHWILAVEAALITLFAVFWVLQTRQLWTSGFWLARGPEQRRTE
jgi:hypothetical protein